MYYFENLFGYVWELIKSPAGAHQWTPKNGAGAGTVPDAHDSSKKHAPFMLTTDLSLRMDPNYAPIAKRFYDHPQEFAEAFAKAWYKLTHRDMGPLSRYLGPLVPREPQIWQDPVPPVDHELISEKDAAALKGKILASGISICQLVNTAWGFGVDVPRFRQARRSWTYARVSLSPQKDWEVNQPAELAKTLEKLEAIRKDFNGTKSGGKKVSLADLIVLGGDAAIAEEAAKKAGHEVKIPLSAGPYGCNAGTDRRALFRGTRTGCRRLQKLSQEGLDAAGRGVAGGPGAVAEADCSGVDGSGGRAARAECQLRAVQTRCLHRPARNADERFLRQSARYEYEVGAIPG